MPTELSSDVKFEIGHVLFIDIVGYSKLLIAGAGINIAQRVMDCGDAGHILLSKRVADDLEQYPQWRSLLQDLGECEISDCC
jgi:class 3 adenylate cyclase